MSKFSDRIANLRININIINDHDLLQLDLDHKAAIALAVAAETERCVEIFNEHCDCRGGMSAIQAIEATK